MPLDVLALAELQLDTLFETDDCGLLLRSRGAGVKPPLVHLVRTTQGNRWLLSTALSEDVRARIEAALSEEPVVADFAALATTPPRLEGVRALLATGAVEERRGPAWVFPDVLPDPPHRTEVLDDLPGTATVSELAWVREALESERPLVVARNEAGEVVSVCHSPRSTPRAAEAGVETAAADRGRGFAGAVTLGWAAAIRAEGRTPLYSTQWTNVASRAVARKLGLVPYGEDVALGVPSP